MHYLHQNLSGKIIVFTGGTDGMGKVAVQKLAAMGAKILLFGRIAAKTNLAISEIKSSSGNTDIHYIPCDLASQQSIRMAAERVTEQCPKIDLLINCVGMNAGERILTEDQMETSWAVNHLAPSIKPLTFKAFTSRGIGPYR
ncbi:SDR family NAD(P)-dependent oxidoreductase [Sediminicola luteus]|nr:SDR family NAD(P)-dependent oxidoreductase [Sediminicola luteus]